MEYKLKAIKIRTIVENYYEDLEQGVFGMDGRLELRPSFQREFVYNDKQQQAVIETVMSELPLGVMHWNKNNDMYQVIDGQQRLISICRYVTNKFSVNKKMFRELNAEAKNKILDYKLIVFVYEFRNQQQKVNWFRTINIAGVALNDQEILNAGYTGSWLSDAKLYFSKGQKNVNNPASLIADGYVNADVKSQGYLREALEWIGLQQDCSVEDYMREHRDDEDAVELKQYYETVLNWAKSLHTADKGITDKVNWGKLYKDYHDTPAPANFEQRYNELAADEEVTKKPNIIEYILSGEVDQSLLSLRTFNKVQMRTMYNKQEGKCKICGKKFEIQDMAGDHIVPWSRGGHTVMDNLQMLCKICNARKSNATEVVE